MIELHFYAGDAILSWRYDHNRRVLEVKSEGTDDVYVDFVDFATRHRLKPEEKIMLEELKQIIRDAKSEKEMEKYIIEEMGKKGLTRLEE